MVILCGVFIESVALISNSWNRIDRLVNDAAHITIAHLFTRSADEIAFQAYRRLWHKT
jgi:hypothetical protein